ncbi:nitrilase-related carbon-nitrogen hydrolase [Mycobacterium tilburgii]|uniref:nitrilase-related carbon-nitrogen hydrolase n=1 Tax=Mycobacterium tilburgii TaxID=44467 RepID=UPI0021B32530|nr:nitrilase-related carbon-nitrogen hydrolase [Mycobacterium tilburgii]
MAVAAVNAAPVFLNLEASLDKLEDLVATAARDGAQLVVFGEAFLAGFPIWTAVLPRSINTNGTGGWWPSPLSSPAPTPSGSGGLPAATA